MHKTDPRFLKTEGLEVFSGNELLLKGSLEAGVAMLTGYPGSPVSEVFDAIEALAPYLASQGIVAQIANNEALATARLNGARLAGLRALAVMKSVGLHVGADALAVGNLMEARQPQGGAVIVVGDDPWNETTQINSDSRYLSKHLHMPLIEPSTFQELKDWIRSAFDLSGFSDLYITYLVTTNQADGGGSVETYAHPPLLVNDHSPKTLESLNINISDTVMIPPHTSMREATLQDRHQRFIQKLRELKLNKWSGPENKKSSVGFVAAGLSFCYLRDALSTLGILNDFPILKLASSYPLDELEIQKLAKLVDHIVVVEEKRGFVEEQISDVLMHLFQEGKISKLPALWGKSMPNGIQGFPSVRGLNSSIIMKVLAEWILQWPEVFKGVDQSMIKNELKEFSHLESLTLRVPSRTPTFCPGCPHRDSSVVSLKLKNDLIKKESVDLIFHGESGCHSMLQFAPNEGLMQNYSGMGLGGGTGAGMSPFITNKQVVFLGDSTFFHSGMIAISDSLKNNQDITYVILQNDTTAMTGHQPTPGNEVDIMGKSTFSQNIEKVLQGIGNEKITLFKIDPSDRQAYESLLQKTVLAPGVKVIIADKECAITSQRRLNQEKKKIIREQGFIAREEKINITPDVCEYCLDCVQQTGCPGLTVEDTVYGRKITTDLSTCVDDGACSRTKSCPSFEKVVIERKNPPKKKENLFSHEIPEPTPFHFEGDWRAYLAAVGGMGAGVVNAVLVRAGLKAGYKVSFLDKKGLAVRNGGVYGHLIYSKNEAIYSPVIPYGKADLMIGLDLLEAVRGIDPKLNLRVAGQKRTRGVVNTHKNETVLSLLTRDDFDPASLEQIIKENLLTDGFLPFNFSRLSEEKLGSKLYANMMILGAAFQKGWIPVSLSVLRESFVETFRGSDLDKNTLAFNIGRQLVFSPKDVSKEKIQKTVESLVEEKKVFLEKSSLFFGSRRANSYQKIMRQVLRWFDLPKTSMEILAHSVYDLIRFQDEALAQKYVHLVWEVYRCDQSRFQFRATQSVIKNLFKCMAIKDEIWVAQLLTSPEKYARDAERYKIDSSNGDRISYVHLNRPRIPVFWGKEIEFDLESKDWMLRIMSKAKFLRKIFPKWHHREKEFRDCYIQLVKEFNYFNSQEDYECYLKILNLPEEVRGYRELRYPKMVKAKEDALKLKSFLDKKSNAKWSSTKIKTDLKDL